MSELEVKKARMEVERSVADFEHALDHLLGQVEQGIPRMDLGSRVRELVDVDRVLEQTKESVGEFLSSVRKNAEEEIQKMDSKPLVTWGAVLVSGFALGYVLAKKTSSH